MEFVKDMVFLIQVFTPAHAGYLALVGGLMAVIISLDNLPNLNTGTAHRGAPIQESEY